MNPQCAALASRAELWEEKKDIVVKADRRESMNHAVDAMTNAAGGMPYSSARIVIVIVLHGLLVMTA